MSVLYSNRERLLVAGEDKLYMIETCMANRCLCLLNIYYAYSENKNYNLLANGCMQATNTALLYSNIEKK